jgi:small subunit ribosomal protein S21
MARKPVYAEVYSRRNEPTERLIRRFVKNVKKAGIIQEIRDRRYYKKPSDRKRAEKKKRLQTIRKINKKHSNY